MHIEVDGCEIYADSAGQPFKPEQPSVIFLHGVLNDHSVWAGQISGFAGNGWNALAVDLPGHGRSAGQPPASVEDAAAWVIALLDALSIEHAALVGHSFGSLIALEAAAQAPQRVDHLVLAGTAFPMRVSPALLEAALDDPEKGMDLVNRFSHSALPSSAPDTERYKAARALMQRVLASNPAVNVFHRGLVACDRYANGVAAMAAVGCPMLFLIGQHDRMAAPRSARALAAHARQAHSVELDAGHALMSEKPDEMRDALRAFLMENVGAQPR